MSTADTRTSILPYFVWPSRVKAAAAEVLAALEGTQLTVAACTALDTATAASWALFYTTSKAFLLSESDPSVWGLGSQMDQVNSIAQDLYARQQLLVARGCTLTVPSIDPEALSQPTSALISALEWTVVGVLALAGAYTVGKIIEVIPKSAEPAKPSRARD